MAEPYLSEIRILTFNFAPQGWAFCDGQVLQVTQNTALYALLGNRFGGSPPTTFALPNLQGRTPIHAGNGHALAAAGGEQAHTLTTAEIPSHKHAVNASSTAAELNAPSSTTNLGSANNTYTAASNLVNMSPAEVSVAGAGQAHQNLQPFLALNFCIALQGIFPPRS